MGNGLYVLAGAMFSIGSVAWIVVGFLALSR